MVRKVARFEALGSAELAESDRRERAAVEECLRSGTLRMFECIDGARDLTEIRDCQSWKGQ
jgi:hypothetical protein